MAGRGIAAPLFVATFSAFLVWYLNQNAPDVRYSLSERIPVAFARDDGKATENSSLDIVQQLEVKNIGNLKAESVLVKINGEVKDRFIKKHAATDEVKTTAMPKSVEVLYPMLPPGASFQVVLRLSGNGIGANDVSVFDSRGQAKEALSKSTSQWAWVIWGIVGGNLIMIGNSIRLGAAALWKERERKTKSELLISSIRPTYLRTKEWIDAIKEILTEQIRSMHRHGYEIDKHPAYQFLNLDKPPELFDSGTWQTLQEWAIHNVSDIYTTVIRYESNNNSILVILQLQRPKHFPEPKWTELETQANERYVENRMRGYVTAEAALRNLQETRPASIRADSWQQLVNHWESSYAERMRGLLVSVHECAELLRKTKPAGITPAVWTSLQTLWEQQYFSLIMHQARISTDIAQYFRSVDLSLLCEERKAAFNQEVTGVIRRDAERKQTQALQAMLRQLLSLQKLPTDRPTDLTNDDWALLTHMQTILHQFQQLGQKSKEIELKTLALKERESELEKKYSKVDRQLQFINDAIADPSAIDRVEEYNDTFSKGNLDNLRKLLQLAKLKPKKNESVKETGGKGKTSD